MSVDVSVIIVNYHTADMVCDAVASLLRRTRCSLEVFVVDNATEPELGERLQPFGERVRFVSLSENVGFGRANNAALPMCTGRNILFLNPDTLLLNDAVDILSAYLDAHPATAAVGGNLYSADDAPAHSYMRIFPSLRLELIAMLGNRAERLLLGRDAQFNYSGQVREVAYITGADLMIRRKVLDEVGAFDPAFFMYYEETDLCRRIRRAGYVIESVPTARIRHLEGVTFSVSETRERMKAESRALYYDRHLSGIEKFFTIFVKRLNASLRCMAFRVLNQPNKLAYWRVIRKYA